MGHDRRSIQTCQNVFIKYGRGELMEYVSAINELSYKNSCVTMGKFDGMHRGHQLLFSELYKSEAKGLLSVVLTFDTPPADLFSGKVSSQIYTEEEKRYFLEKKGMDVMVCFPFTKETAAIEPEDFIRDILVKKLGAKKLVVGADFGFGKGRRGNVELLSSLKEKYGYELIVVPKLKDGDDIISSTLIREKLKEGNIEYANRLLGMPYRIRGVVEHGMQLGRKIGMPTLNVIPHSKKLLPPNGVYVTITYVDNIPYYGVTNIGCKPTVTSNGERMAESHLFNFDREIYGALVETEFFTYERPECKFASVAELSERMYKDMEYAKEYFRKINRI